MKIVKFNGNKQTLHVARNTTTLKYTRTEMLKNIQQFKQDLCNDPENSLVRFGLGTAILVGLVVS